MTCEPLTNYPKRTLRTDYKNSPLRELARSDTQNGTLLVEIRANGSDFMESKQIINSLFSFPMGLRKPGKKVKILINFKDHAT